MSHVSITFSSSKILIGILNTNSLPLPISLNTSILPPCISTIDFTIDSGEVVGLIAPSGFGKTTLAKILAGYEKPQSGSVTIDGNKLSKKGYSPVQLIFQHPEKSVNPKWKMDKILKEAFEPSKELLEDMGIKKEWLNRWPSELSGG